MSTISASTATGRRCREQDTQALVLFAAPATVDATHLGRRLDRLALSDAEAKRMHRTFHESLRFPEPGGPVEVVLKKRDARNAFSFDQGADACFGIATTLTRPCEDDRCGSDAASHEPTRAVGPDGPTVEASFESGKFFVGRGHDTQKSLFL